MMTAPARLERDAQTLFRIEVLMVVCSLALFFARRRIRAAARLVADVQERDVELEEQVDRLRVQLDGALAHIHETRDQGAAFDSQGPGSPIDSQGPGGDTALDSQGSPEPDQA